VRERGASARNARELALQAGEGDRLHDAPAQD